MMDTDTRTTETLNEHAEVEPEGGTAHTAQKKSVEAYGSSEQAANDTFETTTQKVGESYEKAKNFSNDNPGKTIFIALGVGIGLGLLLSKGSGRSKTSRIAEPVVNALADIAREFIR